MTREQALDLLPLLAGGDLQPEQATAVREWLEWDPALAAEAASFDRLEAKLQAALAPAAPAAPASDEPPAPDPGEQPLRREAAPVVTVRRRCPYCHDAVEAAALVVCGSCATPHHGQCFEQNGGCSLLGCGGTSSIAAGGPASVVCSACSRHTPADAPFCAWCGTAAAKGTPLHVRPAAVAAPYDWRRYAAAAALLLASSLGVGGAFGWQQALVVDNGRIQLQLRDLELAELSAQKLVTELCQLQEAHLATFVRGRKLLPGTTDVYVLERYVTGLDELLATAGDRRRRELAPHRLRAETWYRLEVAGGPGGYAVVARFAPARPVDRGVRWRGRSFHATRPDDVRGTQRWPAITRGRHGDPIVSEVDRPDEVAAEPPHRPAPAAVLERVEFLESQRSLEGALAHCEEAARAWPDDRVLQARIEELRARLAGATGPSAWARRRALDRFVERVAVEVDGRQRSHALVEHVVREVEDEVLVEQETTTRAVDGQEPTVVRTQVTYPAVGGGPFDAPTRERTTITVPAGTFPCWHARVERLTGSGPTTTEVWFSDDEPLPYKRIETAGGRRTTTELLERPEGRSQ